MSQSIQPDDVESIEFRWGKKRGLGGKKKEVQFYESFFYDGLEYYLHDAVYLYKEDEPEPYIGKLIKIWEQPGNTRKVKVLWFFRPVEILNWLGDEVPQENELFLASGEGVGLANVNHLEAVAGKCTVICTSKDSRNHQPSEEDLQMADYIFYRTFDVGQCKIVETFGDKIAGVDVKFLLNRTETQKSSTVPKLDSNKKEDNGKSFLAENEKLLIPDKVTHEESENLKTEIKSSHLTAKEDSTIKSSPVTDEKKILKCASDTTSDKKESEAGKNCPKLDSVKKECKVGIDGKVKPRDLGTPDDWPSKSPKVYSDGNDTKSARVLNSEDKRKYELVKNSREIDERSSKKVKPDEKVAKASNSTMLKASPRQSPNGDKESYGQMIEVTRRPDADRSKWFKALPWEERMQAAYDQGTLVLLQNLDPAYTSSQVEDIVWHGFKESCTAKMVQHAVNSSPHYGQAYVIFKTTEAAGKVVRKLDEGCLMLTNGRPLVGSMGTGASLPDKQSTFPGHIYLDKVKQRESKQAVSTSHCSQPNTLEYEMAMEWCLLQERSDIWWKKLYKQQAEELRKVKGNLKSK